MSWLPDLSSIREVIVSKVIDFLIDKLASSELLQFATEKDVHEEIQKLNNELKEIREVLDDAEQRQMKENPVKDWLTDLQNLAYDVEDVLDEFATEIGKRNLMKERRGSSSKRPRLIPDASSSAMFNKDMMSKIKELTSRLKDLEPKKNKLQLRMLDSERPKRVEQRLQPTSVEIEAHVYGRDKDKQTILDLLLNNQDEKCFVIPIVGMGGIGKTTLAQLVYNDASVQHHFNLKSWVCVSDHFDVMKTTKHILESLTKMSCYDNHDLNTLQEMLKQELSQQKFLLVLDDVWNTDYLKWTILQSPFLKRTTGSKIVVTTRDHGVSSTMGDTYAHSLDVLSDDDCMSVFTQHALGARDFSGHPSLKEVAVKIVKKCDGLPLAAKTLGGLLRTNVDIDYWKNILESEIWKLPEHQCGILPALHLSYHHLPLNLKRCFAYCSIIPKDYEFETEEIILLWRAQGFLQEERVKQCIGDLGRNYFKDLVSRSLLQMSVKDDSRFVMHDLINDLAQYVAGEICFKIEGNQQISKHARHLSYIADMYDGNKKFEGIYEAKHLRTFFPLWSSNTEYDGFLTNHVSKYVLLELRCLRALSLKGYQIEELPDSVGDLKLLRYLNLSQNKVIKSLPESVSNLFNLEILLLKKCTNLEKLPSEMEKLVNLCYLDIRGADRLEGMASNFSTLTNLQTLSKFVLGKDKGYQVGELKDLSSLKGQLCISGLQNVLESQDARMAMLHDKTRLEKLQLQWTRDFENRVQEVEKRVLDGLRPCKNLKELTISFYCGAMLANWVGDLSLGNLQSLCLDGCPNLLSLPPIGKLPLLKKVCIMGLKSVTSVGVELFGENTRDAFCSLEFLEFVNMPKWEKWNLYEVDEEARRFPRLRELRIDECPLLLESVPKNLPSLEKMTIRDCEKLIISIEGFPMLSTLVIERCHEVVYKGFADGSSLKRVYFSGISKFSCAAECLMLRSTKVESLEIDDFEELCSFGQNNWRRLTHPMSVGVLSIKKCSQIVSIGAEEEREELMQLKIPYNIQRMIIQDCSRLEKLSTTLHSLTLLAEVKLINCPKLISLARSNLPLNLKLFKISYCHNLESLMLDEGENVNSSNACVLQKLEIGHCDSLKRIFRSDLPSTLKQLQIYCCPKLESIAQEIQDNSSLEDIFIAICDMIKELPQGLKNLKHLRMIIIQGCSKLICFPESLLPTTNLQIFNLLNCEQLQALPENMHSSNSLERLMIRDCPNVTALPEEGIPCNLRSLEIGGANICKLLIEWGLHRLTSLQTLTISNGCSVDVVSFPQDEIGMMLPLSLTRLNISDFTKLEMLSYNGFRNLTSLSITNCPNLKALPEKDTLSSLLELRIEGSPMLEERYKMDGGPDWSNISHIPFVKFYDRRLARVQWRLRGFVDVSFARLYSLLVVANLQLDCSEHQLLNKAIIWAKEIDAGMGKEKQSRQSGNKLIRWMCPVELWIKINTNGEVSRVSNNAGSGGVARDANEDLIFRYTKNIGRCDMINAELWGY